MQPDPDSAYACWGRCSPARSPMTGHVTSRPVWRSVPAVCRGGFLVPLSSFGELVILMLHSKNGTLNRYVTIARSLAPGQQQALRSSSDRDFQGCVDTRQAPKEPPTARANTTQPQRHGTFPTGLAGSCGLTPSATVLALQRILHGWQ
jgi:hypothetical protein